MAHSPIFKPAGFLRLATIVEVDTDLMTAFVKFRPDSPSGTSDSTKHPAQLPISFLSAGGGFIGGFPAEGTPVIVAQAEGSSSYYIVQFLARDPIAQVPSANTSLSRIKIPELNRGEITIQANINGSINLNKDGIVIGEPLNSITFDTTRSLLFNNFDASYFIGQGEREISGVIKRDRRPKLNYPSFLRLNDPAYDDNLKTIGMDPLTDARNSNAGIAIRNPARIEKRNVIYEYEDAALVRSNDQELEFYKTGKFIDESFIINRRTSRVDALSLSLVSPNYLIEEIRGTVVDVFGNIVDINRNILPLGNKDTVISATKIKSTVNESDTFKNAYEQIKRQERKSLAYHFEINTRKETGGSGPPDVNNTDNYARQRSRFYLDIDKEGQFKLNVPASSETGNIGLLTRYENYSTVHPNQRNNTTKPNPNDMVFNSDYRDILIEPFANTQVITLQDEHQNITGPINRFSSANSQTYIKHGTAYHDISKTASTYQASNFYNPFPSAEYIQTTSLGSGRVQPLSQIVNTSIIIDGPNANAGGRSGSLNFDGSIEINIGANTVDRQSLWLDTQGGIIANIGRDLRNVSVAANADGQVLLQIGGSTVPSETDRFAGSSTGWVAGVLDIRVFNTNNTDGHNELTVFRIDNEGLTVTTPSRIVYYSSGDMLFRSASKIELDAETVTINGRDVLKDPGRGPIR